MKHSTNKFRALITVLLTVVVGLTMACGGGDSEAEQESVYDVKQEKAVYGKIQHVDVGATVDAAMATSGKETYEVKCTACHKYEERYVGPALGDVTKRRTPEYVMNMILDTETMIDNDDTVKCLLQEYMMRMPNQSVDEKDARNILEHLRGYAENKQ